jgi:hypothetical protein
MPNKKAPAKRPKNYGKLSQKQKFIAAAKAAEVDESGDTFMRAIKKIAKAKPTKEKR